MFSQIKDKHISHIDPVFSLCDLDGNWGAGVQKLERVGICDGAPSTARSSCLFQLAIESKMNFCLSRFLRVNIIIITLS